MMRLDRHLGGAKWAKKASRRGSRNATENCTKQVSQNLCFWDAKTSKKYYKVIQVQGVGGSEKHQTIIENEAPKGAQSHQFGALWRPLGGHGVTVTPRAVDFEVSQK